MQEISTGLVIALGIGTVFFGLVLLIFICKIMSFCVKISSKEKSTKTEVKPQENKEKSLNIPNKQEFIAAVSAAIAEDLGKDVSNIRILKVTQI